MKAKSCLKARYAYFCGVGVICYQDGSSPNGIAYDPVNNRVYVANTVSNSVSVISAASISIHDRYWSVRRT
jgi:DNA-binding beta-propeller fold protein YncE